MMHGSTNIKWGKYMGLEEISICEEQEVKRKLTEIVIYVYGRGTD